MTTFGEFNPKRAAACLFEQGARNQGQLGARFNRIEAAIDYLLGHLNTYEHEKPYIRHVPDHHQHPLGTGNGKEQNGT